MAVSIPNSPTTQNGHVIMMDPNLVNVNTEMINSIPQYQDMFIFAELTAKSKERTILATASNGTTSIQENHTGPTQYRNITVNFIGNNQDTSQPNPNYLNFTTNWYDGSSGDRMQFEGFGITNIKVVINSSFIPQVNIDFVDVRGLAFFNQTDSPYRILFDFPPPVFRLKLKGYYGMALEYQLHLVKYTSEFKSENGNYVISAQFIALTYAPLTDVLFRYVVNFPLMPLISSTSGSLGVNPSSLTEPKNTYELILKLKNLYTQYHDNPNTTTDTQEYNKILGRLAAFNEAIAVLNNYSSFEPFKQWGKAILLVKNNSYASDGGQELTPLDNVFAYDNIIKLFPTDAQPNNINQRLMIAFAISNRVYIPGKDTVSITDDANWKRDGIADSLDNYRLTLVQKTNASLGATVSEKDIPVVDRNGFYNKPNNANTNPDYSDWYIALDITNYYLILYKQRAELTKRKIEAMNAMNEKINSMVIAALGMKPTIYNVFKIILNDVDIFFNQLRTTSSLAEKHHKDNFDKIVGDPLYQDTTKQIFAFPLVVKQTVVCNNTTESRTSPTNFTTVPEFPEITLVRNFIDTFTKQQIITEQINMRQLQNADGTFKWIPIAPVDSKLATTYLATPYFGIDNTDGGSTSQPIDLSPIPKLTQVLEILLNRYYILSQSSFAYDFYKTDKGSTALIDLFSKSESLNLAISITNKDYLKLLSNAGTHYGTQGHIQDFYDYVKANLPKSYDFTQADTPFLRISNGDEIYTNRKNSGYKGFIVFPDAISTQTESADNTAITNFQKTINLGWWKKIWNSGDIAINLSNYKFTLENVFYLPDTKPSGSNTNSSNINVETRFVGNVSNIATYPADGKNIYNRAPALPTDFTVTYSNDPYTKHNRIELIGQLAVSGNSLTKFDGNELKHFGNVTDVWIDQLTKHDTEIYSTIINPTPATTRLSALILLSNFGYTLSPFNEFPYNLNKLIFNTPAAIQVPYFLPAYVGALIDIVSGTTEYQQLYDFIVSGSGKLLTSSAAFIFADIADVNKYLSAEDKKLFKAQFTNFYGLNGESNTPYQNMIAYLKLLYAEANPVDVTAKIKANKYQQGLNSGNGTYFKQILENFLTDTNIINFSEITFSRTPVDAIGYQSIAVTNTDPVKKPTNDNFFKKLFTQLVLDTKQQEIKSANQEEENKRLTGDDDIITQTYYSLKNINDKWLSGPEKSINSDTGGYPYSFNTGIIGNHSLIDSFVFVDRAMNPIGDTIINPEILINMMDNPNVSIFSVISQLLSMNGFEFFPLQNFMSFERDEWQKSFEIDVNNLAPASPTFVCMYIGGSASYPTGISAAGQFLDDGIGDISTTTVSDFRLADCEPIPTDDNQIARNKNFRFGQVRAFRVRFGTQAQSMFKDIKIDSKEYPETNESLQILSRLAGDNKQQAPPPKGQNLYNLYENRSYRATVLGLGNMMIQPTQYFQLENIPMYNGAYIILGVEHNIDANKMVTSFSGTKILKYPVPRVMQSSAIVGFEGGNTNDTNVAVSSADEVTVGVGTLSNPTNAQYNSMYNFKIQ